MKLPRSLSPKAKKRFLASPADEEVRCLLQVARADDEEPLRAQVESLGGTVQAWIAETRQMTVTIPAGRLGELAELAAVVYLETAETYRR